MMNATMWLSLPTSAAVACEIFGALKAPAIRVCLPDIPAPVSRPIEAAYYIGADEIVAAVEKTVAS